MKKKYKPLRTPRFERELKLAGRRGLNIEEAEALIVKLSYDEPLERKHHDHPLKGQLVRNFERRCNNYECGRYGEWQHCA